MAAARSAHGLFVLFLLVATLPWTQTQPGKAGHGRRHGHEQQGQNGLQGHGDEHHSDEEMEMGVPDDGCDNAEWRIWVDWDTDFMCQPGEHVGHYTEPDTETDCLSEDELFDNDHICMNFTIHRYRDQPPRSGEHRPLWAKYGRYLFAPPERWLHNVEHGAAVFLYHPCADPDEVEKFQQVAQSCLWKHITSPYRPMVTQFAVITYGCKLTMNTVDVDEIVLYLRDHALHGPEDTFKDGQYDFALIQPSANVTVNDTIICPWWSDE